ncbi:MAG: 1,4-dihydroxy-6-naphthoate synthase [Candidatus Brocadiaceae bacterium]
MNLSLGFSPCPNDTFIFDAMINNKIDTEGLSFEVTIADVEELNRRAFRCSLDITKLSYYAYAHLTKDYILLHAGSALGNNCGPLLISKPAYQRINVADITIAIPGTYTTANFLLSLAYPDATRKVEMRFSDIENAILQNKAKAGVIIHENRFTYQAKGLVKILDLGEYWETQTGLPVPLGGIVVKRKVPLDIAQKVNRILRKSVEYAFAHQASSSKYVRQHAQEMDESVRKQHIQLYVNNFTADLEETGKRAIMTLFSRAYKNKLIPNMPENIFLQESEEIKT